MIEGWHKDDYLILFEEQAEAIAMTARYSLARFLPGYTILGLRGSDDFILRDGHNGYFTIPTVPLDARYLQPFDFEVDVSALRSDERLMGKIKWYVQPLIFGGDPNSQQNTTWVTLDQHAEAVRWWNQKYCEIKPS